MKKKVLTSAGLILLTILFFTLGRSSENQLASWFIKRADKAMIAKYDHMLKDKKYTEYCNIKYEDQYSKVAAVAEKPEKKKSELEKKRHIMKLITTEDVIRNGDILAWPLTFLGKRKVDLGIEDREELKIVFILFEHLLDLDKQWKDIDDRDDNPFLFHYQAAAIFGYTRALLQCYPSIETFIELSRIFDSRLDYPSDRRDDMIMRLISGSEWEQVLHEADKRNLGSKRFRDLCHYYIDGCKEAEVRIRNEANKDRISRGLEPYPKKDTDDSSIGPTKKNEKELRNDEPE